MGARGQLSAVSGLGFITPADVNDHGQARGAMTRSAIRAADVAASSRAVTGLMTGSMVLGRARRACAIKINSAAMDKLPSPRNRLGKALIVRFGNRSHNRAVGGAPASNHVPAPFAAAPRAMLWLIGYTTGGSARGHDGAPAHGETPLRRF